ncbi:MAG: hypothetical protein HC899_37235 [Leptolyngbyaceae cyanobacterium SM1_4_3]|nr:hypothetical protein [Leptolyngbyaceae cyanobacterium SM1_4_3]
MNKKRVLLTIARLLVMALALTLVLIVSSLVDLIKGIAPTKKPVFTLGTSKGITRHHLLSTQASRDDQPVTQRLSDCEDVERLGERSWGERLFKNGEVSISEPFNASPSVVVKLIGKIYVY